VRRLYSFLKTGKNARDIRLQSAGALWYYLVAI
jgi:hypothetical protein